MQNNTPDPLTLSYAAPPKPRGWILPLLLIAAIHLSLSLFVMTFHRQQNLQSGNPLPPNALEVLTNTAGKILLFPLVDLFRWHILNLPKLNAFLNFLFVILVLISNSLCWGAALLVLYRRLRNMIKT